MATFKNDSTGVQNYAGTMVAPGATFDADESHPGIKRMVDRKVISKVSGSRTDQSAQDAERKAELLDQIEKLTGNRPAANSRIETLEGKLKEAQEEDDKKNAGGSEQK